MIEIGLGIIIFTDLIMYLVFFDVILSWLNLFWLNWRPIFVSSILDPLYKNISNIIPTTFWMFKFDALIVIICIYFIQGILLSNIPWLEEEILRLINSI